MVEYVVDVLNRAARLCSLKEPNSWLSESRLAYVELRDDFLVETVDEIIDRKDLIEPIAKKQTLTGNGSERYQLNSSFVRLTRNDMAVYEAAPVRRAALEVGERL